MLLQHIYNNQQLTLRSRSIRLLCFLVLCWVGLMSSRTHAQNTGVFLPPDKAFVFQAQMFNASTVRVQFTIAPNYYMYRDEFAFKIVSADNQVSQAGDVKLPTARIEFDPNFNKDMAVYENAVSLNIPIQVNTASETMFKIVVTSRGCAKDGLCYPPRQTQAVLTTSGLGLVNNASTSLTIKPKTQEPLKPPKVSSTGTIVETAPNNPTSAQIVLDNTAYSQNIFQNNSGWLAFVLVFGLGLLLAFTPCMLPMYPILTTILSGQTQPNRARSVALAFAYVTGMAFVYALIGLVAAQTGAGLYRYMQNPWVLAIFSMLLLVLALSMFDLFQIQLPTAWQAWIQHKTQGRQGYIGALIFGAASALIASPCVTAPLVGLVGYIAQTGDRFKGGVALLFLAYGMGLPLILMGAGLGKWLPKSGVWMLRVKQFIGIMMLFAALWVSQPLWYKTWLDARGELPVASFVPVRTLNELQTKISQSDQPVFVDVYADWCRSCIEMERKVFPDPRVRMAMQKMTLLRVDMTKFTDDDAEILAALKLYGPPAILVFEPIQGRELMRIIGFQNTEIFAQSLNQTLTPPL